MKKLLFGILIIASGLVFYACNSKSGPLATDGLKTNANDLVASDSKVDNAVEATSNESDLYSLSTNSITEYSNSLKSGIIGGSIFKNMFELFPFLKLHYLKGICPDMTFTTTNGGYPKTLTLDYGDSLVLANGRVLKGKIIIVISADPFVTGSTRSVTFENFSSDSISIAGTITKSRTKDTQPIFSENCDLTITLANGTTIHRVGTEVRTWVAGSDTPFNPADDIIDITGNVTVSDSNGNEYSKTITTPLVKTGECKFITKGVIEYKNSNGKFATIDYGNGDCDNLATRTTQNGTKVITLGRMGR